MEVGSTMGNVQSVKNVVQEPRFVEGRPMRIAGLRGHYTRDEIARIPAQWQRLVALGEVPGRIGRIEYAVVLMLPDGCDYISGYEVGQSAELPAEFHSVDLPGERYAVFAHEGHVSKMQSTFVAIFSHWLPASGYKVAESVEGLAWCIERYGEKFNPQTGSGDIEIWVPVTARVEKQKQH